MTALVVVSGCLGVWMFVEAEAQVKTSHGRWRDEEVVMVLAHAGIAVESHQTHVVGLAGEADVVDGALLHELSRHRVIEHPREARAWVQADLVDRDERGVRILGVACERASVRSVSKENRSARAKHQRVKRLADCARAKHL